MCSRVPGERPDRTFHTVQLLRGVACLLVVAYHAIDSWGSRALPRRAADSLWPNGAAGVDLFFVISGFVMATSTAGLAGRREAAVFIVRRLRRVVPLYWSLTSAKLAVLVAFGATLPGWWPILSSFLFIPSRDSAGVVRPVLGVGWTLQFEMLFYGLVALTLWVRRPGSRVLLSVLLPLLASLALAGGLRRPDWPAPTVLANGLVLEFCLGVWVAGRSRRGRLLSHYPAMGAIALGLLLLLTLPPPGAWRFALWGGPAALILTGAVSLERAWGARLPANLLAIGEASYAIYLSHPFVVPVLSHVFADRLQPAIALPLLVCASLVAATIAGVAVHRWLDRPLQRLAATRRREALPRLVQP